MSKDKLVNHAVIADMVQLGYLQSHGCVGEVEYSVHKIRVGQLITFRGTEFGPEGRHLIRRGGWRDLWRNLRVYPSKTATVGRAHAGYAKGAIAAVDQMIDEGLVDPERLVVVAGHSLGGGLAQCAAIHLYRAYGVRPSEVIHKDGPWRGLNDVERATLTWVDWFNSRRLLRPIGDIPPSEHEMLYDQQTESSNAA